MFRDFLWDELSSCWWHHGKASQDKLQGHFANSSLKHFLAAIFRFSQTSAPIPCCKETQFFWEVLGGVFRTKVTWKIVRQDPRPSLLVLILDFQHIYGLFSKSYSASCPCPINFPSSLIILILIFIINNKWNVSNIQKWTLTNTNKLTLTNINKLRRLKCRSHNSNVSSFSLE